MNYFIYGARRSGKTYQLVQLLKQLDYPVVCKIGFHSRQLQDAGINVYYKPYGLRQPIIRVYENIEGHREEVKLNELGFMYIVTCTPNTHKYAKQTEESLLFERVSKDPNWNVIHAEHPNNLDENIDGLMWPKHLIHGQLKGEWYDETKHGEVMPDPAYEF